MRVIRNFIGVKSILYLLIALIIFLTYCPSLLHSPRADQLIYLHFTDGVSTLKELTLDLYDFNRTTSGDLILFRPILYFFLGFEKWLFGYNFWAWQLTNIIFHILVVFALLVNLQTVCSRSTKSQYLSFLVALLFGVQYMSVEMVAWHHISGYLAFTLLLLWSIYFFRKYQALYKNTDLLVCFTTSLLSAFTYELGNITAFLYGIFIVIKRNKTILPGNKKEKCVESLTPALIFFAIPSLYIIISFSDIYFQHGGINIIKESISYFIDPGTLSVQSGGALRLFEIAQLSIFYIYVWSIGGIIPGLYTLNPGGRINLSPEPSISVENILVIVLVFVCTSLFFLTRRLNSKAFWKRGLDILLLATFVFSYALLNVYGRGLERGVMESLSGNSYYAYICNALVFLLVFQLFSLFSKRDRVSIVSSSLYYYFLVFSLVIMIMINANKTHDINRVMVYVTRPWLKTLQESHSLIQRYASSYNFSFKIEDDCKSNPVITWFGSGKSTLSQVIFPKYYQTENPTYEIPCSQIREPIEIDERVFITHAMQPILLHENYKTFNLVKFGGVFYGIPQGEGEFTLDRVEQKDYSIFFVSSSVISLQQKIDQSYPDRIQPILLQENYKTFNLVKFGRVFYGIPQGEGEFTLDRVEQKDYSSVFKADSLINVKKKIDGSN